MAWQAKRHEYREIIGAWEKGFFGSYTDGKQNVEWRIEN
jgi:hypothetical protein